ncbi:Oligouridylate-binding protein 1C [Spathaspora sp. JA1]|nr:Oligouridylate-binding protein 1C [Spathaspora sp. JA1]
MTETEPTATATPVEEPQQEEQQQSEQQPQQQPQQQLENPDQPEQQVPVKPDSKETTPVTPASAIEGGREVSNKILYVGNLSKSISEEFLKDTFSSAGTIQSIKILNDKNKPGFNYAFIDYENNQAADMALNTMNGKILSNYEIKINWAFQSATIATANTLEDPSSNIFVGDLSPEINDEKLKQAFSKFKSLKQAHVMWDMQTSRSRGYGFVTFSDHSDAELALQTMNGEWINGRAIRCNWASHKQMNNQGYRNNNNINNINNNNGNNNRPHHHNNNNQYPNHHQHHNNNNNPKFRPFNNNNNNNGNSNGHVFPQQLINPGFNTNNQFAPPPPQVVLQDNGNNNNNNGSNNGVNQGNTGNNNIPVMSPQSYDIVLRQTPSWQTTVYLGNIAHFTQQGDLIPLLTNFGYIVDFKFHPEKGCAFVKYDNHERAALAIVQLAGFNINGRPLKCGWGKDRPPPPHQHPSMGGQFQNFPRGVVPPGPPPPGPPHPSMYGQGRP